MTQPILDTFLNYGIAGAIIVVLLIYLNQREKQHASERETWRLESNSHVDKFAKVIKESTEALTIIHGTLKGHEKSLERIEEKMK